MSIPQKQDDTPHPRTGGVGNEEEDPLSLPPHGTEIFLGGLPRSCTEDQLREFASKAGDLHSIRLSKDPASSAQNKGYGFVMYKDRESAVQALQTLNGTELADFSGYRVRAAPSQANNRLWIGNIPLSIDKDGLRQALEVQLNGELKGLQDVDVLRSKENPEQNRGYAFLEFYNSSCALHAKKRLSQPDVKVQDRSVQVELADPAHGGAKNVYVGNLPSDTTEETLKSAFEKYGAIERTFIPRARDSGLGGQDLGQGQSQPRANFGFVHFLERASAVKAVEDEEKPEINGVKVTVKYGKPDAGQGGQPRRGGFHSQSYLDNSHHRYGMPGMMVPMVPVQLPNGQMGYMLQPTAGGMVDDGPPYGGSSWGRGGGRRGGGGYRGRGRGRGYGHGHGYGYGHGQHRYQPY
jgi:heterogeneous nuclear ribonucleoprotein R